MATKGAFLEEKAANMRRWLQETLREEVPDLPTLDQAQSTYMAEMLVPHKQAIKDQDFTKLAAAASELGISETLKLVADRPTLHDKFWRYLALFVEVVEQ